MKNPFSTIHEEQFLIGESNLEMFLDRPQRLDWGILFICRKGKAVISTEILTHELIRNSKVMLMPGTIFTLHEASPDFNISYFAFSIPLFNEANYRLAPSFFKFLKEHPVYHLPEEKAALLTGLFPFITSVYEDKQNQFRYDIIKNQLQSIFWDTYDKIHQRFQTFRYRSSIQQEELFRDFLSLIRAHCREQRDVAFYANQLCITPRYLSFIVREITRNKSAKEMINQHLVLEIKVLLQSSRLTIQEIANQLNFPDQSYLGRYFKRYTGISPTEYRSKGRESRATKL